MCEKYRKFFLFLSILSVVSFSTPVKAEMDTRIKALLIMSGYGAIGGALLGTASLAFDGDGRSIAKGASIGLYAGILFGSYVVMSHYFQKQRRLNPEPDPYYDDLEQGEEEGGGGLFGRSPNWQEYKNLENDSLSAQSRYGYLNKKTRSGAGQDFYLNVLTVQF